MPERRMFSKKITDTDAFLDMPASTQNLYFHFAMHADDDGFIGNPKRIMAMVGASEDDKKVLLMKRFILLFDTGVIVIKHWKIHNLIQSDRYHETTYLQEKSHLKLNEYKAYTEADGDKTIPVSTAKKPCIQNVYKMETEVSIGKDSIVEDSIGYLQVNKKEDIKESQERKGARAPALEDVKSYFKEKSYKSDPQKFYSYYDSRDWLLDGKPIRKWQSLADLWESREKQFNPDITDTSQSRYTAEELDAIFTHITDEDDDQ